jgi:putative acetyltransferase
VNFTIATETPLQDDVRALVAALNAWTLERTPREFTHHLTVEQMAEPSVTLFVARDADGSTLGMGALKRHEGGVGEVKRMFVRPEAQGRGVGGAILGRIEALAREQGCARLVLETGSNFDAARHVYERAAFQPSEPVLDYSPSAWTSFYAKELGA